MLRTVNFLSAAIVASLSIGASAQISAAEVSTRLDPDGTFHAQELAIPPSKLTSPEFNRFYVEQLQRLGHDFPALPPSTASKSQWDEFDRAQNKVNVELLAKAKELYAVSVEETNMAGVRVATVTPRGGVPAKNKHRVLINLRGSGFVANRGLYFGQMESVPVAAIGGFKVITLDYRQAPYDYFPAATQDVEAVYRFLLKTYKPEAIGIYGCSAGGLLAAQSVAWFADKKLPRPGAVGVLCMSLSAPPDAKTQFYGGGDAEIFTAATSVPMKKIVESFKAVKPYMGKADRNDPLAWPGSSDRVLAAFPPTLFLVGTREGFMSTAVVDHARMTKLGVEASLYVMEGAPHAAHIMAVGTPEAHDANGAIARFFDKHLAK